MKLRGSHISGLIVLIVCGFVILAVLRSPEPPKVDDPDEFLRGVQEFVEEHPEIQEGQGALPGIYDDPSLVPVIALEPEGLLDLGTVPNDDFGWGEAIVRNQGKRMLEIKDIQTNCACTLGNVSQAKIPPGDQTVMKVRINPYRIPGFESEKILTIQSNDPERPMVQLRVRVDVEPEFEVEPRVLDFGVVRKGQTLTRNVLFREVQDEEDVEVTGIYRYEEVPGLHFDYALKPEDEWAVPGRAEYLIAITLDENIPVGPLGVRYGIQSTWKRFKTYRCGIRADVEAFYSATRNNINAGRMRPGTTREAVTAVTSNQPFDVENVSVTGEGLSVSVRPAEEEHGVVFDLTVAQDAAPGNREGFLSFSVVAADGTRYRERFPLTLGLTADAAHPVQDTSEDEYVTPDASMTRMEDMEDDSFEVRPEQ